MERLVETVISWLGCVNEERKKSYKIDHALYELIAAFGTRDQREVKLTPFDAHFGRKHGNFLPEVSKQKWSDH